MTKLPFKVIMMMRIIVLVMIVTMIKMTMLGSLTVAIGGLICMTKLPFKAMVMMRMITFGEKGPD